MVSHPLVGFLCFAARKEDLLVCKVFRKVLFCRSFSFRLRSPYLPKRPLLAMSVTSLSFAAKGRGARVLLTVWIDRAETHQTVIPGSSCRVGGESRTCPGISNESAQ